MFAVRKFLIFTLISLLAACGGGGGGSGGGSGASGTGIESEASKLRCTILINQNESNIDGVLEFNCPKIFGAELRANDKRTWSIGKENTCDFLTVDSNKKLNGIANDDDVGECRLVVHARTGLKITVYNATVQITNDLPTLSIADTSFNEDSSPGVIRIDSEVQSNEEGFGKYSLAHATTSGTKCADHGSVSIDADTGAVSYTPTLHYNGTCNIKVKFDDQHGLDNIVEEEFAVTINPVNDAPSVTGDCATTSLNQDIAYTCNTIGVFDPEAFDTQTWSFDGSNDCVWAAVDSSTGAITGTPTDNHVGSCTLAVKVNDGTVDSSVFSKTITVNNVTPTFPGAFSVESIAEDASATVVLTAVNVQADEEGFGVYSLDNANTTGTKCSDNGTVAIDATTGAVTYTPTADYDGSCNVRVVFDDQNPSGNTVFQEATINITAVNDDPIIDSVCALSVNELAAYSCTGAFTDVDNASVTWSLAPANTCSWAAISSTTGNVTGTPARSDVGSCDLVVRVDDGAGGVVDKSFSLTVNNVAPVVTVADTTLAEDSGSTEIRADADVDSSDEGYGTYSLIAATGTKCSDHGTVSIDGSTGAVTFAPDADYDGICNINVQFDDGQASNNLGSAQFALSMLPSADIAQISLPSSCNDDIDEDVAYSCTPVLTDPDTRQVGAAAGAASSADTHTWSIDANTCSFASITAATGRMAGTPNDDQVGACSFTISVVGDQDGLGAQVADLTASFNVINVKPVLTNVTGNPVDIFMHHTTAPAEYSAKVKNTASIVDFNSTDGAGLGVFSLVTAASDDCGAVADTYTIDTNNGEVTFLPNDMYSGTCYIAVSFDDENSVDNIADTIEAQINVIDEVPPIISYLDSADADGTYYLTQTVSLTVKFNEPVSVNTTGGSPRIFLETGVIDRTATYTGISGDNTELYFDYEIQEDDKSDDLEVHSTVTILDQAGAVIEDLSGNTLVGGFPIPKPADATGNSLSERKDLAIEGSIAEAEISGYPTRVSPDLILNVDVSGGGVVTYRYKVVQVGTANDTCDDATGYSSDVPESTNITDSLVPFPLGSEIRLCVVGKNALGNEQPLTLATEYVWSKDVNSIQKVSFGSVNNLPNWQDSEVDPDNPNRIFARNLLGEVYKSMDYGVTWEKQCKVPQTYQSSMEVSPGPDRTAYVYQSGVMYKVEELGDVDCPNILSGQSFTIKRTNYENNRTVHIINNGDIYLATSSNGGVEIWRSFDQGTNWYKYADLSPAATNDYHFDWSINPDDPTKMIYTKLNGTVDPSQGTYLTDDAGVTWTKTSGQKERGITYHPFDGNVVYRDYRAFSEISTDGGNTWTSAGEPGSASSSTDNHLRYDFDKVTGYAYRLRENGSNTELQVATNPKNNGTISWSLVYSFNTNAGVGNSSRNISVSGNATTPTEPTISVNILDRMWVSSDGGTTFTEVFAPEELKLLTIAGAGDNAIYGATKDWRVVKTVDNGDSWTYKVGDYYHCLGKPPRLHVNQIDVDNILMWTENYGTINCDNFNYSTNGMNSLLGRDEFSMVAPKLLLSTSPYDPGKYYMSGKVDSQDFKFHETSNFAYETTLNTSPGNEYTDPMPDSFIHPHDDTIVWMVDNISNGRIYEYDLSANTKTNITSRTGLTSIAAIDVYSGDKGQYFLRAMDRTGRMKVSSDYGATFSDEGTTGTPLTSCDKRFLYHHPRDRNLVVTACLEGNIVAISKDSGTTWDETDVYTEYDINCTLTGIAVSSSRMYLGCRNSDTMIFNYSFASLEGDVADSVLTAGENGNANDLVSHFFPSNYTTLEYAVIPAGDTCDETVASFSTTVPKSNDPAFTTRGEYKVCIKQTDLASVESYTTTSTIFYDTGSPTFTSIDLINDVADAELTNIERNNDNLLVGNLVSSDHDFVKYKVVPSATTCDVNLDYSFEIPKSSDGTFVDAGTYKVCVALSTRGGVNTTYGASSDITFVPTQVTAVLSGTPVAYVSIDDALDVTVSGTNVTQYKYKVVNAAADSCGSSTGYSSAIPVGTKITDSLSGYSSGDNLRLCVLGGDASGYFQNQRTPTQHRWVYSTNYRLDYIDFSTASSSLQDWRQVAVHPNNANIIYALNTMGEVWRSNDAGSNWDLQCRVTEYRTSMKLKVSPGDDNTAYIGHYYQYGNPLQRKSILWRVSSIGGASCSQLGSTFRSYTKSDSVQTKFSFNKAGHLYYLEDQYDSVVIRKSTNQGRTWSFVGQLQDAGLRGQLYIDPKNEDVMLVNTIENNSGSGTRGLYKSTDGGETWSFVQSTGFTSSQQIYFDPLIANRVYANNSYFSTDNGSSWSTSAQFDSNGEQWWVDSSGKGYRLEHSGSDTVLMRSNTLGTPSFSSLYVFSGMQASDTSKNMVSATGNTIAVVIDNAKMFISTDAGVSFTQIYWPGSSLQLTGISSVDGKNIYGVGKGWNSFRTADTGSNWEYLFSSWDAGCNENEGDARVFNHHLDTDYVTIYSDGCRVRTITTTDGYDTYTNYNSGEGSSDTQLLVGSKNPQVEGFLEGAYNYGKFHKTSNRWSTRDFAQVINFSQVGGRYIDGVIGYNLKDKTNSFMIVDNDSTLDIVKLEGILEANDITSRLSIPDVAGMAVELKNNHLNINHIAVSQNGRMNISTDDGETWSSIGTGSTGLASCEERHLYVNRENSNMMVTACNRGNELAWTINRGSTWTRMDLDASFGINCALTGVVMNHSEIMFSCKYNVPAMRFNYNPVNLLGELFDGKLTAGEISGATIAGIANSSYYSTIEYAVISEGGSCNVSTPGYSTTAPVDSDISGLGDGKYQICVKLDNGSTTYSTSSVITYDGSAPVFTSINLANEAVDGIQLVDYLETSNVLVDSLIASGHDTVLYALVDDAVTCNADVSYSTVIPRANSKYFTTDGDYKVCVALSDDVNPVAYGQSATISFSRDQVIAQLTNLPNKVSADLALNITVGGTDVDAYQYKVGNSPLDCSDSSGYSTEISTGTLITDDISGLSNGNVTLCVRGIDTVTHKDQTLIQATEYTWEKSNVDMNYVSFNANSFARNWFDVEVAKWDGAPHIYARDLDGNIFRSTDRGTSFELMCKVPHDSESRISLSTLKSHGAFVVASNVLYRIEALDGDTCINISGLFTSINSTYQKNPVSFDSKGKMYVLDEVSGTQTDLYSSTNLGDSWTLVHTFSDTMTGMGVYVDPHDDQRLFFSFDPGTSSSFSGDLIVTRDGGLSFFGNNVGGGGISVADIQDLDVMYAFDPANQGYLYSNTGFYSSDNLYDISNGTGAYVDDLSRFDVDYNGLGYRLIQNGSDIEVHIAPDMSNAAFALDKTISGVTADELNRTISVSRDGTTIAVIADSKMYLSLDAAAYTEVFTPIVRHEVTSITSEDLTNSYVIDRDWNVLKTSNSGGTWAFAANYAGGCAETPRIRTSKANTNYVMAYAESTNICQNLITSTDGGSTFNVRAASVNAAANMTIAMDAADENNFAISFNIGARFSTDFLATFTTPSFPSVTNTNHGFDGVLSTIDSNIMFNVVGDKLYELEAVGTTKTDETSRLTFTAPSAMEGFPDGSIYVISRTGQLDISTDDGANFSSYAGDPGLASCAKRTLRSSAVDPANIIASACIDSTRAAYTLDGGASWTEVNLSSIGISSSCSIRDIAIINDGSNKLFISCKASDAVYIEMN